MNNSVKNRQATEQEKISANHVASKGLVVAGIHNNLSKQQLKNPVRDNQQGPTVQHMEVWSMLCGSLDREGIWGRMDTCICMAEFLCCSPETITTLFISYTPIQDKKFKKIVTNNI